MPRPRPQSSGAVPKTRCRAPNTKSSIERRARLKPAAMSAEHTAHEHQVRHQEHPTTPCQLLGDRHARGCSTSPGAHLEQSVSTKPTTWSPLRMSAATVTWETDPLTHCPLTWGHWHMGSWPTHQWGCSASEGTRSHRLGPTAMRTRCMW
jgi:hypothetical protein